MVKITKDDIGEALKNIKPKDVIKMLPDTHFLMKTNDKTERAEAASYLVFKNLLKTTANIQQAKAVSRYVYQVFIHMSQDDWEIFDSFDDKSRIEILGEVVKRAIQGYQAYLYKKHGMIPQTPTTPITPTTDKKQETDQMATLAEVVDKIIKIREGK
jgi:hypothetical protein